MLRRSHTQHTTRSAKYCTPLLFTFLENYNREAYLGAIEAIIGRNPLAEQISEEAMYSPREATGEEVKEYLTDAVKMALADRLKHIDKRYDYIAEIAKKGRRPYIMGDMDAKCIIKVNNLLKVFSTSFAHYI